jgi:hypothetical protein
VRVLREHSVLDGIDPPTRLLIERVVAQHNRARLPRDEDDGCLFFLKLLRDADKLDIWRVVTEYYQSTGTPRSNVIELGLPDVPLLSDPVATAVAAGKTAKAEDLRTLNDFKVLQMAWVYDLNFAYTCRVAAERRYLDKIYSTMPQSASIREVYERTRAYLDDRCRSSAQGAAQPGGTAG